MWKEGVTACGLYTSFQASPVYCRHLSLLFHFIAGIKSKRRKYFAEAGKRGPQSPYRGAGKGDDRDYGEEVSRRNETTGTRS